MKTNFLLYLIACMASTMSTGQAYQPLLEEDKLWLEASFGPSICDYTEIYQLRMGSDTLINGQSYRKIMRRTFIAEVGEPYCPPFVPMDSEWPVSNALIRENVEERKVYLWVTESGSEYEEILIYDFNLEPGDTIPQSSYLNFNSITTVTSVDEVLLHTGESRKRINFITVSGEESSYIEGLGGDKGLYHPFADGIGFWNESLCIQQNGVNLFGGQIECAWVLSTEPLTMKGQNRLYPNPTVEAFTFELTPQASFDGPLSLVLYSLDGREVFSAPLTGPLHQFQPRAASGMYLWLLRKNGDVVDSGKLVME